MEAIIRAILQRVTRLYLHWERWLWVAFGVLMALSLFVLLFKFHRANTLLVPASGGTYIEGSVGTLQPLNPWFTVQNDVNRDVVSLIFSGLLRYNPESKKIEGDLATYTVSNDRRIYTIRLKDGVFWHDSTKEHLHPVTADDVLFTFKTIQDPDFPNSLLRQNFRGVTIERLDARTVQFKLDQPYSFFPSNLTLGLLPKDSFKDISVKLLDQTLDFGFSPIGAGPYKIKNILETELSTEITLERADRTVQPFYKLDRIVFRIFSDYPSLLSDLRNLDGIRLVPHTNNGKAAVPRRFIAHDYSLPQYVALFFNLDRRLLSDGKLRLGLQLGTDKQSLVQAIGESVIVDTPLLEIDDKDWRYHFDSIAAQGALFASEWYFPEKLQLQHLLEQREANATGLLKIQPVVFLSTGAALTISGSGGGLSSKNRIHGIPLSPGAASGSWAVALPTVGGTGALKIGMNLVKLTDDKGKVLDSFYVRRTTDAVEYQRATAEQELITQFLASKNANASDGEKVLAKDLYVDRGYLRKRRESDPIGVRINDAGKRLSITLLTSPSPASYAKVADIIRLQWAALGVEVNVVIPETRTEFEDRLLKRDYDVLLYGQSLLDNLDSYPYWHSSGVQKLTDKRNDLRLDAYNLSQYAGFEADSLLEIIRSTGSDKERTNALGKLKDVLKRDVPAVFLYSPLYTYAHREGILGIKLGSLSLHSDRFLTLYNWYVKQDRVFEQGKGWLSFFGWLSSQIL